ncbi:ADP-ribosyl cyclase/cyclic ADP-ribose hydrolase [Citrus sinensis]|nr:ADP-ribosyl cyclase/cyclic ADP-ribose hydrolase [Citrus sinensis]
MNSELEIPKELVGMESRLEKLKFLMCTGSNDVRTIGIWGMGEGSVISLQKQLLSDLLKLADNSIRNVYDGVNMIGSRLRHKKVLLLIDDVADVEQLRGLAGKRDWFGPGSRIIITTRDEHLLKLHRVEEVYKLEALNFDEAFRLFCLKAFDTYKPLEEYSELAKCFVKYASGLPLAVDVLGSFLFGRPVDQWRSTQERLKRDPENKILDILQISFDGLKEAEKNIFLDVACFYKWENRDYVSKILDSCGFDPIIGISVLIEKSLLTVRENDRLWMHDLLQEMGQQIVRRQSPDEPGRRSRLWEEADVSHVLSQNTGSEVVEGIMVDDNSLENEVYFSEVLKHFRPLNMLKVMKLRHSENLIKTPDLTEAPDLEELDLKGCTSLTTLSSKIFMKPLKTLVLSGCLKLRKFPHVAGSMECLRELLLDGTDIKELPVSIELLSGLVQLSLKGCKNLLSLPIAISSLKCLRNLKLSGCSKLKKFPQIVASMEDLLELYLDGTSITEVPSSIELLHGLELLNLNNCKNLVRLPNSINGLKLLKTLNLSGCFKLENMPETIGQVESLEELDISGTAIRRPPSPASLGHCCCSISATVAALSPPLLLHLDCLDCYCSVGSVSAIRLVTIQDAILHQLHNDDLTVIILMSRLSGVMDDKGKYIYISHEEMKAVANYIRCRGRVSISYLASKSNQFIDLESKAQFVEDLSENTNPKTIPNRPSALSFSGCSGPPSSTLWHLHVPFNLMGKSSYPVALMLYSLSVSNPSHKLSIVVPGSEIPKWFMYQNEGSSITATRPSYFYNMNKVVGYAICCVFHVPKHSTGIKIWCSYATYQLECSMDGSGTISYIDFREIFGHCGSDHLWLLYLSRQRCYDTNWHFESNHFRLSFIDFREKFGMAGPDPVLKVKRCGFHPVYMHEVEEFDQTTKQWTRFTSYNLNEFHHDFVGSDMAVAEARGSVCWDDYDEKPQPKRFRPLE